MKFGPSSSTKLLATEKSNIKKIDFDELYVCIPSASRKQMQQIIMELKKTKKPFKTLPSMKKIMEGDVLL